MIIARGTNPNGTRPQGQIRWGVASAPNDLILGIDNTPGHSSQLVYYHYNGAGLLTPLATGYYLSDFQQYGARGDTGADLWQRNSNGSSHTLYHYNGTSWTSTVVSGFASFQSSAPYVAGASDVDFYQRSSGSGLDFWHWNGSVWVMTPVACIASSPTQLFAGGGGSSRWCVGIDGFLGGGSNHAFAQNIDGSAGSFLDSTFYVSDARSVYVAGSNSVWVAGTSTTVGSGHDRDVTVWQWNGSAWVTHVLPYPNPTDQDMSCQMITGTGPNDIWVGGVRYAATSPTAHALVYHWDGTSWTYTPLPSDTSITIEGEVWWICAIATNDVWALGNTDMIRAWHWDGVSWSIVPLLY